MNERTPFDPFKHSIDVEYDVQEVKDLAPHSSSTEPEAQNPRLNIILFVATLFTTTYAGALSESRSFGEGLLNLHRGLPFSLTLLTILLCHEFGHYLMARKHRVQATLPFFIPGPPFLIGTFGAVIKMRSPLHSKNALLDVGAAGPLAGVMIAIPATLIGLYWSEVQSTAGITGGISLGSSLLLSLLERLVVGPLPDNYDIFLHPVAFAGWIGLLVTMLNLIPVGQLDGGHIVYALLGKRWHGRLPYVIVPVLLYLGLTGWTGWVVWCVLLVFVMGTRHPPTMDEYVPLDPRRRWIGWLTLSIFILTFTPVPFDVSIRF